jgi:uncharacterized protein YbjT (DUF2867 family)
MNYVLTGSIGHISKPIAEALVKAGHNITIITSSEQKVKEIEKLGAKAAVGNVEDASFVAKAFSGADAVYLMVPPKWTVTNWLEYQKKVADNYISAIAANNIKYVVQLSSIGAHMKKGAGPVDGLAYLEDKLEALKDLNAVHLRPSYFYYNLFSLIPLIKNAGIAGGSQSADHKIVLTHTNDIAEVAAEVLLKLDFKGKSVKYISSDERSWAEVAHVLGKSIGIPNLPWVEFTDEQSLSGMLQAGLSKTIADAFVQMGKALRINEMESDYWKNRPATLGKVKLEKFAEEFAAAYKS